MTTGQALVGNTKLTIPKAERTELQFYTPLLLVPGNEPQFLQMSAPKKESQKTSFLDFYRLLPMNHSPLVRTLERDEKKILAIIPASFRGGRAPQVNLEFRLTEFQSGRQFPLEAKILESKKIGDERIWLVVELNLPDLKPGDFELEIKATESTTQAQTVMTSRFSKR